jgi:hypothetical protein
MSIVVPPKPLFKNLSHWIPLLALIGVVPSIIKPFFSGPDPLHDALIFHLSHCILLFSLIIMVPITYKSFSVVPPTHFPL